MKVKIISKEQFVDGSGTKKCCLCGKEFKGYGNNPSPLANDGYCCDDCNTKKVIPARVLQAYNKKEGK